MDSPAIIDPSREFLLVKHSFLNGPGLDFVKEVEKVMDLEKYLHGRKVVPCFEGDLLQLDNGQVILTHQSFFSPSESRFENLRQRGIATTLEEMLESSLGYFAKTNPRIMLCLEPKPITTQETIDKTIQLLKRYGIQNVYFDSFYGGRLDMVSKANGRLGTSYQKSLHLCGNVGGFTIAMSTPSFGYNMVTVPFKLSFGKPEGNIIYGAVGDISTLSRISEDPKVLGAYCRLRERSQVAMLFNSITNTVRFRKREGYLNFKNFTPS